MKSIIIQLVLLTAILAAAIHQSFSITDAALEQERQMNKKVIDRIERSKNITNY